MPWNYYRWRWRRRRRPWLRYRRPRKIIRRRWTRRRPWVRRFFKRKLKTLNVKENQPKCIRKCKIKGLIPLLQCTAERIAFNYDLYELSTVPERLPGGGGFGIKNFSLRALYAEHRYGHNIWTKTNEHLPLCRYLGCKMKFYQSELTDYVVSYSNTLPLESNIGMYNTMQPSMHCMVQNKLLVPSRKTYPKNKPYFTKRIRPPTQLLNRWYFQSALAKTPLVMLRTSSMSMEHFYLSPSAKSSNITIPTLNTGLIKNRNFKKPPGDGYFASGTGTQKVYLYTTRSNYNNITQIKIKDLVFLGDSKNFVEGHAFSDEYPNTTQANFTTNKQSWTTTHKNYWGNPFYPTYLNPDSPDAPVFQSPKSYATYISQWSTLEQTADSLTEVFLVHKTRYNPHADYGQDTKCYFLSVAKEEQGWEPPDNEDLTNENLPLWLLLWGFPDFQKKLKKLQRIDEDYILVIIQEHTRPIRNALVPLSTSFINGWSPYENQFNKLDSERWHPQFQYQQEIYNDICTSGPGTAKVPNNTNIEAKVEYCFYFKWGGDLPPMSVIEDPTEQPFYPVPSNKYAATSLQNPESRPERLLYSFDERRGTLTKKALKRISKDWETKTTFITDGGNLFSEPTQLQETETSETSSSEEEETETLLRKLHKQRTKQRAIKQRILNLLQKSQKSE
nr:MAG: ORF1 [TTV-like mini virus]